MPKTTSMGLCMKNRLKPANPAVLSEFIKYRKEMNTINCLDTTVSYFANYYDKIPKQVNLFGYLQNPTHLRDIRNYRQAGKGEVRKAIKSRLPCITPSGIFSGRNNDDLVQHSGLICMDIDAKDNPQITDWERAKGHIAQARFAAYISLSVSGEGLFVLVPVLYPERHKGHFLALAEVFERAGYHIDPSCGNVARLRGCSYDPHPYINTKAEPFAKYVEDTETTNRSSNPLVTNRNVERLIEQIEQTRTDITAEYRDWLKTGYALAAEFGEAGREYYHRVCRFYPGYDRDECDEQYRKCLNNRKNTIGSFFYLCDKYNIRLK